MTWLMVVWRLCCQNQSLIKCCWSIWEVVCRLLFAARRRLPASEWERKSCLLFVIFNYLVLLRKQQDVSCLVTHYICYYYKIKETQWVFLSVGGTLQFSLQSEVHVLCTRINSHPDGENINSKKIVISITLRGNTAGALITIYLIRLAHSHV